MVPNKNLVPNSLAIKSPVALIAPIVGFKPGVLERTVATPETKGLAILDPILIAKPAGLAKP